jgi:hypothetical protein
MNKIWAAIAMTALIASEAQAADWRSQTYASRQGAFVGARMSLPLGHRKHSRPIAELAIAPTNSRVSNDGKISTSIGQGMALRLSGEAKPSLMLAGIRADQALGLNRSGRVDPQQKMGLSTGVAVGIGVVVIAAGVAFALLVDAERDASSRE